MHTYEVVQVKWLKEQKWGVKETVRGHPPHICKLCDSEEEAEKLVEKYNQHRSGADMRRAS